MLLPTIPIPSTGESQTEKIYRILKKKKVPYQGSWKKVFEQTYSQQTDNKEQTGTLENLFSIQSLKISFIGFVIVPVMCISYISQAKYQYFIFAYFWKGRGAKNPILEKSLVFPH